VRVRVVEFSADFVRVRSVSGPCRVRVVEFSFYQSILHAYRPRVLVELEMECWTHFGTVNVKHKTERTVTVCVIDTMSYAHRAIVRQ